MLTRIRAGESQDIGKLLHVYQGYLHALARRRFDQRLQQRLNPSDLVQETLLVAHRDIDKFRGNSEGEFVAWLRQILCNCLSHAVESHVYTLKRDVRREVADAASASTDGLRQSPGQLARIPANGATPSEELRKQETTSLLWQQLRKLKPDYRQIIIYRNLQGLTFEEIAQRMDRNVGATRMLWLRAVERFKRVSDGFD